MVARVALMVFPGGFNWPLWVAQEGGLFAHHGVDVHVATTPGSVFQWTTLARGEADLAITLLDNVIAYRESQGEPGVEVPDAIALMGADVRSMPSLVTLPGITHYDELKGRALAVDSLRTGNALVLMGMLERGGLRWSDYELAQAGGVSQRFEALRRGEYAGSLFNAPLDESLRAQGFHVLDRASSLLPSFQGHVVAARRGWAHAHRSAVIAFLRGFLDAVAWLYRPANRPEAFALYARNMPDASPDSTAGAYDVLFHPDTGFPRNGALDEDGIRQVIALRERFGTPRTSLRAASSYYDPSFLAEALAA